MSTSVFSITVPGSGFGPAADVSSLVGEKTVVLSGRFRGAYVLYGSHDGVRFAPLLIFNAGGIESIRQTFKVSLAQVRLKSLATGADGVSATVSGLSVPGDNSFASLGVGGVLDLGTDLYQVDLNFMGFGQVGGKVVVEGSNDGAGYNPIGEFASSPAGASLLGGGPGIEFSPVVTTDRIRYVRLSVQGSAPGFVVTVGGAVSEGTGGGAGTLAATYDAGSSQADQTMTIADVKGGMVIFDASEGGFSGVDVLQVLVPGGIGAGFKMDGGMRLGLNPGSGNILINCSDSSPLVDPSVTENVVIGDGALQNDSTFMGFSVVIGANANAPGGCVAVGASSVVSGNAGVAIGDQSNSGVGGNNVAVGSVVIGGLSDWNTVVGGPSVIGDGISDVRPFEGNVKIGSGGDFYGSHSVSIGFNSVVGDTMDLVPLDSGVAIGNTAVVKGQTAVAIGPFAHAEGEDSLVMGYGALAPGYAGIAMGTSALSGVGSENMAVGSQAAVFGIGDANLCVGFAAVVGDPLLPSDTRDFHNNIYVGGGYGVFATFSVAMGSNVQIGQTTDSEITDSDIAIGNAPIIGGTVGGVPINNGIAIGKGATITNIFDQYPYLGATANDAIAIGTGANTNEEGSIAIGNLASIQFVLEDDGYASGDIAIGSGVFVNTAYGGVVAIGMGVSAYGEGTVVLGNLAYAGDFNSVVIGHNAQSSIGSYVTTVVGANALGGAYGVSVGSGCDTSSSNSGIAIGQASKATGDYGMAFGRYATAGANEVVFGSANSGFNVTKFRAVSVLGSYADLFTFDQSLVVGSPDTTSMSLLIQKHSGGTIVSVPVTLSAIDIYGNSYLQVANS